MQTMIDNTADVFELSENRDLLWQERLINQFAGFTQYITWPFLFLLFHTFFDINIRGKSNFKLIKSPFIIISNHISFYESFVFRLILGIFTKHLPLRFMAVTKFEDGFLNKMAAIGVVDFIYSLFGVFTVVPGLGLKKNLEKAKDIIKVGGNIVIYPEGKITRGDTIGVFKRGAAVLMSETGVSMIPVSFRLGERNLLRRKFCINVGGPLQMISNGSIHDITESLHKEVQNLFDLK